MHQLPDYQLKKEVERVTHEEDEYFADNNLIFSKKDSPQLQLQLYTSEKKFEGTQTAIQVIQNNNYLRFIGYKTTIKSLANCCHKMVSAGHTYNTCIVELTQQINNALSTFSETSEIFHMLKYTSELLGLESEVLRNFINNLETVFVKYIKLSIIQFAVNLLLLLHSPLNTLSKNEFDKWKDARKKYIKQQEDFDSFLNKLPSMKKDTPLMTYSVFLKSYFQQGESIEMLRLSTVQILNNVNLEVNVELCQALLGLLTSYKNVFSKHKELAYEVDDLSVFLSSVRSKKQQMRQTAASRIKFLRSADFFESGMPKSDQKLKDLSSSILSQTAATTKEGYLFCGKSGDNSFERRYYKIQDGKLYKAKHEKNQIVMTEVVCFELTNLKEANDFDYFNCFQLSSPSLKHSLTFVAETEYECKEWCLAIKSNIEHQISKKSQMLSQMEQSELKKKTRLAERLIKGNVCADCGCANPSWLSCNFLVVICLDCSGFHRKLGVLSKVRSLKLDQNDEEMLKVIQKYGNQKMNLIWEALNLGPEAIKKPTPNAESRDKEIFIRSKYLQRKFFESDLLVKYPELKTNLDALAEKAEESHI